MQRLNILHHGSSGSSGGSHERFRILHRGHSKDSKASNEKISSDDLSNTDKSGGSRFKEKKHNDKTIEQHHRHRIRDIIMQRREKTKREMSIADLAQTQREDSLGAVLYDPVAPDETIQNMDVFLSKKIRGVTIQQFYDTIWKEPTLFHNWLEDSGKMEVSVGKWDYAPGFAPSDEPQETRTDKDPEPTKDKPAQTTTSTGLMTSVASSLTTTTVPESEETNGTNGGNIEYDPKFIGDWCKEHYTQHREVSFAFKRTTHLYMGPPIAHVKHSQWLRMEEDERCVMHIQVDVGDVPFGNTFNVQIRWVATRTPDGGLQVQAGLHVVFVQAVMVANKIKSGTTEETIPDQQTLFDAMKAAFADSEGVVMEEHVEDEEHEHLAPEHKVDAMPPCFFFLAWFQHLFPPPQKSLVLANQAMAAHVKLFHIMQDNKMRQLAMERLTGEPDMDLNHKLESELTDVHSSLDEMLKLLKGRGRGGIEMERQDGAKDFSYEPTHR